MENKIEEALAVVGIDCATGIERVLGNEALYVRLLKKFLVDKTYMETMEAIQNDEVELARTRVHTLKGLSANLSMNDLHAECVMVEERLKKESMAGDITALRARYGQVVQAIENLLQF